jgi:DNA-binding beta-propeller fold protein YncE
MRSGAFVIALAMSTVLSAQSPSTFHLTHSYVLGGDGGWDYIVPDPPNHRLFIGRQTRVMVVDEDTGKLLGEVPEIHGAHGTAIDSNSGNGFATSSQDKSVVMFDAMTLKVLKRIPAAEDADAIVFDEPSGRVFSLNGDANSSTIIDGRTGDVIKNLPLGGKPEYGVSAGDGKLYVNITDKSEIVEIDTKSASVTRRWPTAPCEHPVSVAIDKTHHRLFSGCRSGVMVATDYQAGKVVATAPIGNGVDGGGYDPQTANVFASNGDGTLTVIHQDGPDKYAVIQTITTPIGSRSSAFDPMSHRLFVVSAKFGPVPPGGRRGPVLPDTFTLMVFGAHPGN